MANDRQRPSADQAESDNNTSDTDVVAALHAFEPLAAVTDNDQTVVPEITRLLASLKKFMSNVGFAQSKSGLPEADSCGAAYDGPCETRRRRPLPRPRFGLNSSTACCQLTISSSYQILLFALM